MPALLGADDGEVAGDSCGRRMSMERRIVVMGCGRGIGRAILERLFEDG
jgi:hypothetical protein